VSLRDDPGSGTGDAQPLPPPQPGQASGLTHRVRELVGVQVVAGVDGGLISAVIGQQLRVRKHRDRLLRR
jgi:hypothetical protein